MRGFVGYAFRNERGGLRRGDRESAVSRNVNPVTGVWVETADYIVAAWAGRICEDRRVD